MHDGDASTARARESPASRNRRDRRDDRPEPMTLSLTPRQRSPRSPFPIVENLAGRGPSGPQLVRRVRQVARTHGADFTRERARPRDSSRVRQSARRVDPAASDPRDEEPGTLTAAMHNAYGAPDANDNSRGAQLAAEFNRRLQTVLDRSVPHIKERWGGVVRGGVRLSDPDLVSSRMVTSSRTGWASTTSTSSSGSSPRRWTLRRRGPPSPPRVTRSSSPSSADSPSLSFVPQRQELLYRFCMTFFSVFDVPVFWPILLMYWFMLFFMTMKQQIKHT